MMKETLKTSVGTVLTAGLVGSLLGAPAVEMVTTAAAAGGTAGIAHAATVPSDDLELRDVLILLAPTVVATVAAGLTMGWSTAFVGPLTGPLASLLRVSLTQKENRADPKSDN